MENGADAGEILVSAETAARLPAECSATPKGPGVLLAASRRRRREAVDGAAAATCPPRRSRRACRRRSARTYRGRRRLRAPSGHRRVPPVRGDRCADREPGRGGGGARRCTGWSASCEAAAERQDVALLASDFDADGGKLILTAGAPKVTGDDEERMLLALRAIVEPTCRCRSASA